MGLITHHLLRYRLSTAKLIMILDCKSGKNFYQQWVRKDDPDADLKELIALMCKTFFDKEINIANINTMDNALDLVVPICPEARACGLIPVTYLHYDVKGDPYGVYIYNFIYIYYHG